MLFMGVDQRADESGPTRSDSLILAGLNATSGAALVSIPRDLWVTIPGVGEQRINTALFYGHDPLDTDAGPLLAVRTVEQAFGRPVDRYLVLDFQTFVHLVDAVGGIQVNVPRPITDTQYPTPDYGITAIHFDAGPQALDGQQALVYVRTRHADDDFGRSERQQQVIQALAIRLAQPATWARLPEVLAVLQGGVQTNLTAADASQVLQFVLAIADGDVATARLDGPSTTPWITPGGAWVLLPNWEAIDMIVAELFGAG
jgi:LCP family protein required for cell wall assembly